MYFLKSKLLFFDYRVSNGKLDKVMWLCWGYEFRPLLIFWVLLVHEKVIFGCFRPLRQSKNIIFCWFVTFITWKRPLKVKIIQNSLRNKMARHIKKIKTGWIGKIRKSSSVDLLYPLYYVIPCGLCYSSVVQSTLDISANYLGEFVDKKPKSMNWSL